MKSPRLPQISWTSPAGFLRVITALRMVLQFASARQILHPLDGSPQALQTVLFQAYGERKLVIGSVDVGFGIFLRDSAGRARRKLPPATFDQVKEMVAGVLVSQHPHKKVAKTFAKLLFTLPPIDTVFGREFNEDSPEEQPGEPSIRQGTSFSEFKNKKT